MSAAEQDVHGAAAWQAGFLAVLPAVETHAAFRFRRLPAERREEAVQEAIASACVSYRLLAVQGKLDVAHASTIAKFAVRHVRSGRHVGGSQDAAKDVMSPAAQRRHGVRVVGYDPGCPGRGGGGRCDGWRQVAVADRRHPIPDTAAFRIDFGRWLTTLGGRDREVIDALVSGERTSEVAARFGVTPGRVAQLRRRYERAWQVFQGDGAIPSAA